MGSFLELSMSPKEQNPAAFRPKRIRRSIKLDRVQASDYNKMMLIFACEHCSFFSPEDEKCMMGMPTEPHLLRYQMQRYNSTGHMAFCRFLEID
jgi:hypothetical protein